MSIKLIQVTNLNGVKVRVTKDTQWGEFVVTVSIGGVVQEDATYYTDSKDDALGTAELMLSENAEVFA